MTGEYVHNVLELHGVSSPCLLCENEETIRYRISIKLEDGQWAYMLVSKKILLQLQKLATEEQIQQEIIMLENSDFLELLEPIKQQINESADISEDDIHSIVMANFPSNTKIEEIADFIQRKKIDGFRNLTPEERIEWTRKIVSNVLEDAAKTYFRTQHDIEEDEPDELLFSEEEWANIDTSSEYEE